MRVTIRDAVRSDASTLWMVHTDAWQAAYADVFAPAFLAATRERLRRATWSRLFDEERVKNSSFLAAVADGAARGFARFGPTADHAGSFEVFAFYVAPRYWGSGIAQNLMSRIFQELRTAGAGEARLWTLPEARRARRFYEKTGWALTPDRRERDFGDGILRQLVQYRAVVPAAE